MKKIWYYVDYIICLFIFPPKEKYAKKQVLILYNLSLGDGVIFRSSAHKYRKLYNEREYEITFACQKGIDALYKEDKFFDHIITFDFVKSSISIKERFKTIKKLRQIKYDVLIDPIGIYDWSTNVLMSKNICAKEKIGIIDTSKRPIIKEKKIRKVYHKIYKIDEKSRLSLLEYYQKVIEQISNKKIVFNVGFKPMNLVSDTIKLPSAYYVIFPSASTKLKRWPIERFAQVAEEVYKKTKLTLVLCGTSVDQESVDELISKIDVPYQNFLGKTNLNDYFCIIKKAKFVITNDTSSYHIALTNQTPVVIVSGGYDFDRYIKYDFKNKDNFLRPFIAGKQKKCFNCYEKCPYFKKNQSVWPCLDEISVQDVLNQVNKIIEEGLIK